MATTLTRKRIRALYLQPAPLFGGAERQAAISAALLPEFGVDVVPMVGPGHVIADWLSEQQVDSVIKSPNFPGGWPKQRGAQRLSLPWRYLDCGFRARAQIEELVHAHDIDVILSSLPFAWITGSVVARRVGIPIVWRAGGIGVNWAQRAALRLLTSFMRPDLLLCNAEAVRRRFSPLIPAPVEVVPNGVDRETFYPGAGDPRRYRAPDARFVVGYAARLASAKRPQDFISLAARLRTRYPDARFLLAGEGSERPEYERLARELGADNLKFLGFVSDMPSFYAACDMLVLTSRSEGCSNFMLEAMAMNKPVVAADIPPVLELTGASERALLYKLRDVEELTERVAELLSHTELRHVLATRAHAYVADLTARGSAARVAAILKNVVAEHSARLARASLTLRRRVGENGQREAAE